MRLIDADNFIEYVKNLPFSENAKGTIYNLIANQPTAYDKDKILAKIDDIAFYLDNTDATKIDLNIYRDLLKNLNELCEIVKGGGISE